MIFDAAYLTGCDGARLDRTRNAGNRFSWRGTYEGLFYVADVEASGPPTDFELHIDLDEADLLIVFPLKGKGSVRLVGNVHQPLQGGDRELTFDDVSPRAIEHLKLNVSKVNWFSTYRVHHRVADSFRHGRAMLLGDAAHIHSPVGGQGMNTGIGDAVNLAWKLAAVLKGRAAESLLDTYESERIGFARRLVATTDRGFTFVTAQGRFAKFARTRLVPILLPLLFRISAVRRFFFRTASQIGIQYRKSPLSVGGAGSVRGGDRLPWVATALGEDNFSPLTSLAWQVHVYGDPRPGIAEACTKLGLSLNVFTWQREMRRAGLMQRALYLVRPDGYVALADPKCDATRLRALLREPPHFRHGSVPVASSEASRNERSPPKWV